LNEEWKILDEYGEDYFVSDLGRVKSFKQDKVDGKILEPEVDKDGYYRVALYKNRKRFKRFVHVLVLETFIGKNNNYQCNHKNGIKSCNNLKNLKWITNSENIKHAFNIGLKSQIGELNNKSKFKNGEVWLIKKILNSDYYKFGKITNEFIGKMFNVKGNTVSRIKTGKRWSHIKYEG